MGKIKENIIPWMFGVVCAIVCMAAVLIIGLCCEKADIGATINIPDIKIYIKGEIKKPGLYKIGADTRLIELIEIAGGTTENADIENLNPAAILADGTTVVIPKIGSDEKIDPMIAINGLESDTSEKATDSTAKTEKITSGTVNINTAGKSEFMQLPGIGEVTAEKIVNFRNQNGEFLSVEELMKVPGIGQKTFDKLKNFITVE